MGSCGLEHGERRLGWKWRGPKLCDPGQAYTRDASVTPLKKVTLTGTSGTGFSVPAILWGPWSPVGVGACQVC